MDLSLSDFGRRLGSHSGINELMEDLGTALASGETISMGGGNPAHIPAVEAVWRRRLTEILDRPGAMESMLGDYDTPRGRLSFLETVAGFLAEQYGWPITAEHVAVTAGSQTAFFLLFNMLTGAGATRSRIVLPVVPEYIGYADQPLDPQAFVAYRPRIDHPAPHRFKYRIDFDRLQLDDRVAALCLSRPTNPSANVITDEEVRHLLDLACHHDALLVVDNAYGAPVPGVVFADISPPPWDEHLVMSFSLSKLGLPTCRNGIVVAHPTVIKRLAAMNAVVGLATGSIGQVITEPLFASREILSLVDEAVRPFYRQRCAHALALIDQHLADICDYQVHEPEGAFFLWLWLRDLPIDDRELYRRLKARGLIVVPGSYFFPGLDEPWDHRHQCLRLSYCQSDEAIRQGVTILADEVARAYSRS